jgi:hypothetical protein
LSTDEKDLGVRKPSIRVLAYLEDGRRISKRPAGRAVIPQKQPFLTLSSGTGTNTPSVQCLSDEPSWTFHVGLSAAILPFIGLRWFIRFPIPFAAASQTQY